jgi:hypothetical protein
MTLTQDNNDEYLNDTTLGLLNNINAKNLVDSQFCSIMETSGAFFSSQNERRHILIKMELGSTSKSSP